MKLFSFQNKKAQGALEFLMTYGWAFLVTLIMIGALAYFGVLSPTKFLPERCTFGSQFVCKDYLMNTNGATASITVKLQNNLGQAIYLLATNATNATSPEGFGGCTISVLNSAGTAIGFTAEGTVTGSAVSDGGYFTLQATKCGSLGGMVAGSKYKVSIPIAYYAATSSGAFAHTVDGELFANVETG
ncbi:hypothetical protein HZA99_02850 [Candidatus Woesearchaeota archaeon]|nr:hypothetical protein [Candidatus Woesearchaeota archaeon]